MTRWLLDENLPLAVGGRLAELGQDVVRVGEIAPGASDESVLSIARAQQRVLVSFDRDFGDLIFGKGVPAPRAVVYLRVGPPVYSQIDSLARMIAALDPNLLEGHFTVVGDGGFRRRPLPTSI